MGGGVRVINMVDKRWIRASKCGGSGAGGPLGCGEAKVRYIVGAALEHPREHEADHRGGAHRDRRVLLDHVAGRGGELVEILLVEGGREAGDGRRGRARIVAILLAEFAVDGAGAVFEQLSEAADGFGGLDRKSTRLNSSH